MISLKDIASQYGFSKSTARRKVMKCFPDLEIEQGKPILLSAEQASIFADWLNKSEPVQTDSVNESALTSDTHNNGFSPLVDIDAEVQRRVNEQVQAMQLKHLEQVNESLVAQVKLLESEIERLHAALEREQNSHLGFWNRLGQKLLGAPKDAD